MAFVIADVSFRAEGLLRYATRWQFAADPAEGSPRRAELLAMDLRFLSEKYVAPALELKNPEFAGISVVSESEREDLQYNTVSRTGLKFSR